MTHYTVSDAAAGIVSGEERDAWVPKDNVIFELGATMARLGPQKTFILVPQSDPPVQIPSYFDDFTGIRAAPHLQAHEAAIINYKVDDAGKPLIAEACRTIETRIEALPRDAGFHSDLPSFGIAKGYYQNFVKRLERALITDAQTPGNVSVSLAQAGYAEKINKIWNSESKFTLTIYIPSVFKEMEDWAEDMKKRYDKPSKASIFVGKNDDRPISIQVLPPQMGQPDDCLNIVDVPTTLFTSQAVIKNVEKFWQGNDGTDFQQKLERREIRNFVNALRAIVADEPNARLRDCIRIEVDS